MVSGFNKKENPQEKSWGAKFLVHRGGIGL